jgi:hypothetical protein
MRLQNVIGNLLRIAVVMLALTGVAEAQAVRTWVSGVGDDANPCSRTAPCKTFPGAISKTAAGGVINVLDPGTYASVTITKNLTIDAGGMYAAVLATNGITGIIVNGSGIKVTLRGLSIQGAGTGNIGVRVMQAGSVTIEDCTISDFVGNGIDYNVTVAGLLSVSNTTVNRTNGVVITNGRATFNNYRSNQNASGLRALANALVTARDSAVVGGGEGFATAAASAVMNVENSLSTANTFGAVVTAGSTLRLSNTGVLSNSNTGLFNDGSSFIVSMEGNSIQGNPTAGVFTSTAPKQ